ncbi:hypothetical protein SMa0983 (plasmid) [Sinorhizobium meliloti 1021]|uniref:Uncharacterized protein n=1 Tax=Rhizobium meliloti (strain 1021) TaxID=266834 RepID=Q92ZF6_RHIME|nr:hypothetical protein SMa0983 [Sinorhizobium meliloti 1021]
MQAASTKGSSPSRSKIRSGSDVPMIMPNSTFPRATARRPSNGGPSQHSMQRPRQRRLNLRGLSDQALEIQPMGMYMHMYIQRRARCPNSDTTNHHRQGKPSSSEIIEVRLYVSPLILSFPAIG